MMLSEIEEEIVEDFNLFDDPMDRYEHLIDIGKELAPLAEEYKVDELLVKGCQSKVWLRAYEDNGLVFFEADSNTVITKGIIALLIKVLSGLAPTEIDNHALGFIEQIHLHEHLSSQRSNGLTAMIRLMKNYAKSYA